MAINLAVSLVPQLRSLVRRNTQRTSRQSWIYSEREFNGGEDEPFRLNFSAISPIDSAQGIRNHNLEKQIDALTVPIH